MQIGTPNHPCDLYSRWRTISFVRNDNAWDNDEDKSLRVLGSGPFQLVFNGVTRTVVSNLTIDQSEYSDYNFDSNFNYTLCDTPENRINGSLYIRLQDGTCVTTQNPAVNLDGFENSVSNIINLPDNILKPINQWWTDGEQLVFQSEISFFDHPTLSGICSTLPLITEENDEPVFGILSNGIWLIFDPRLHTVKNTSSSPLIDGGKEAFVLSEGATLCANAPRTFLNDQQCKISQDACVTSSNNQVEMNLDNATIAALNLITGRYVYGIKGLLVNYDGIMLEHPCTPGLRSRWEPVSINDCVPSELYNYTNSSLFELISQSSDSNPYIKDIHFPENGKTCHDKGIDPEIQIEVDGVCWRRVHDEYLSVFDVSILYFIDLDFL